MELENIAELPSDARVEILLGVVRKAMKELHLSWIDITKQLVNEDCPLCASRIRDCLNCRQSVSVGTRKCLHCGESLERVEIEPTFR